MEKVTDPEQELKHVGLINLGMVFWNPPTPVLYEQVVRRNEGYIAHLGPIVVRTGNHTGRSPHDRFIVDDDVSHDLVDWGDTNKPFDEEHFEQLRRRLTAYIQGKDLFVQDVHVGADNDYRLPVRVISETAWHSLFARNMFRQVHDPGLRHDARFTLLCMPNFKAIPDADGAVSEAFIILSFKRKMVLVGGTAYAGENKKAMFSAMNLLMPDRDVLPMHCSANVGQNGDTTLFFGLSGTGKTTLSADPKRKLIGDDEHGWSPNGIFNFEGGCYAKVINLSAEDEPEIFETTRKFGTILENVGFDINTRRIDLFDGSLTENTRAAYPLTHIPNIAPDSKGSHPVNVVFLTADAFGILPPISRLTTEQAMYHYLNGYTAKLAGAETGIDEPKAAFSACFGAPFMIRPPSVYADLLGKLLRKHNSKVWLVNTGWTGGPYGTGRRIEIKHTRRMLNAALDGELEKVDTYEDPIFGFKVPVEVTNVPREILTPRKTWDNGDEYDKKAKDLASRFHENFKRYAGSVSEEVKQAGPIV